MDGRQKVVLNGEIGHSAWRRNGPEKREAGDDDVNVLNDENRHGEHENVDDKPGRVCDAARPWAVVRRRQSHAPRVPHVAVVCT